MDFVKRKDVSIASINISLHIKRVGMMQVSSLIQTSNNSGVKSRKLKMASGVAAVVALLSLNSYALESEPVNLKIDAQNTESALLQLAEAAGVQIVFSPEIVRKNKSPVVRGSLTINQALEQVLKNTNLTYMVGADDVVTISEKEEAEGQSEKEVEEIVVTGSSLRKKDLSAPLDVFTKEDLQRRGIFSAEDFVRSLSANFGNLNESSSTTGIDSNLIIQSGMSQSGIQGSAAANLRGLGVDSTLVLVNGRRVAKSPVLDNGYVDLNGIAFSEIERIEVLYDGASAKYGSDAVGGVINFILSKEAGTGATTEVRYEHGQNGGNTYNLNQSFRYSWGSGRARLSFSKEDSQAISSTKAGWYTKDLTSRGGQDSRYTGGGQPGGVYQGYDYTTWTPIYVSLPADHNGVGAAEEDFSRDNILPNDYDLNPDLSTARERTSFRFDADQDLDFWNTTVYLDASLNKNETLNRWKVARAYNVTVPESNAFNPFDEDVRVNYIFMEETESGLVDAFSPINQNENYNVNLGFKMDLPFNDWTLDVTGRWSEHSVYARYTEINMSACEKNPDTGRQYGKYYDPNDPNDPGQQDWGPGLKFQCDAGKESAWSQLISSSDPNEAINLFGNGTAQSARLAETVTTYTSANPINNSYGFNMLTEGALFSLPGGEIRLALGMDRDVQVTNYEDDGTRAAYAGWYNKVYTINEGAFFETSIPIIGEGNALPGVQLLELGIQNRWTRLEMPQSNAANDTFTSSVPKVTLAWMPYEDLIVRGTWSESFRAPSNTEIVGAEGRYDDPVSCQGDDCNYIWNDPTAWASEYIDVDGYYDDEGNFIDGPAPVYVYSTNLGVNPNIRPETAENITFGFDWMPSFLPGLQMKATYNIIDYTDRIAQTSHYSWPAEDWQSIPDLFYEDPETDKLLLVRNISTNLALSSSESVNFDLSYSFSSDMGNFLVGVNGTYTGTLEESLLLGGDVVSQVATVTGSDKLVGRAFVDWQYDNMGAALSVNYKSDYVQNLRRWNPDEGVYADLANHIEEYWTLDLTGRYTLVEQGLNINFGIRDITNNPYPFIDNSGRPFDNRRVNVQGRTAYMNVTKEFDF